MAHKFVVDVDVELDPMNPRTCFDHVGIIAVPDRCKYVDNETVPAFDFTGDREQDIAKLKSEFDAVVIVPLYALDHSVLHVRTTPFSDHWDSGQIGWVYATKQSIDMCFGSDISDQSDFVARVTEAISQEIDTYDCYLNGEVYCFTISEFDDKSGSWAELEHGGGYYSREDAESDAYSVLRSIRKHRDRRDFPLFIATGVPIPECEEAMDERTKSTV